MKDYYEQEFKKTAKDYGHGIAHLKISLESLKNGEVDINKIGNLINISEYSFFKDQVVNIGDDMVGKNKRIYYQIEPDVTELRKIEAMNKANTVAIPVN